MVNSPEHSMLQVLAFKVATLIDEDDEIIQFNSLIENFFRDENMNQLVRGLKTLIRKPARLQLFDDVRRVVPLRLQMEYNLLVPYTSNRTRNVRLLRRGPPTNFGFGFSIRGGREHGTGFFVSAVEVNSEAHQQGLRIGDQIVRINGFSVEDAIHQEVLHLIQSYNHLNLKVRSVGMIPVKDSDFQLYDDDLPAQPPMPPPLSRNVSEPLLRNLNGAHSPPNKPQRASLPSSASSSRRSSIEGPTSGRRVPPGLGDIGRSASLISFTKKHDPLTWRMVDGKTTPPLSSASGPRPLIRTISEGSILEGPSTYDEARDIKLFLDTTNHSSLGVSICKGAEQRPGIYVQGAREGGLAWEAGLATGDQIIDCNGVNFENIPFEDAVRVLKSSKQLDLLVRKGSGLEMFGESSGYNSSSSSVNGDHEHAGSPRAENGKRLSLITEDPGEEGERSRSNSRRGPDDGLPSVQEHADTVDSQQERRVQVSAQVHHTPEEVEGGYAHPLAHSSSGSSMSSLSSALSHEVKRRSERREEETLRREEERRRREVVMKAVPEERRQKHALLMQEFQQVHRKMFTGPVTHQHQNSKQDEQERLHNVASNGDIYAVVQNGAKSRPTPLSVTEAEVASAALAATPAPVKLRRGVEMNSIDTMTLNSPLSPKPKPPAVYFGAGHASSKSQPGVVTISEYPSDRRAPPSRLDFLASSSSSVEVDDPQSAFASELQNTLSRSNLRQLSEPVQAPPPPPPAAPSPPPSPKLNGGYSAPPQVEQDVALEMRRVKTKITAVNAFRRTQSPSPPPVIALKPLAVPYTELVNQQLHTSVPESMRVSSPPPTSPVLQKAQSPQLVTKPAPQYVPQPPQQSSSSGEYGNNSSRVMESLSNIVTIKFPNGQSASAGSRNYNKLMSTAPNNPGILKHGNPKHKTVIHQKSITFGEITTVMCVQVQDC